MNKLDRLFQLCEEENIEYEFVSFRPNILGLYVNTFDSFPTIGINKSIQHDKFKLIEVLSEELGHHFTSSGNHTVELENYRLKLDLNKSECKAIRWACNYLISDEELVDVALTTTDFHEMSDILDVPHYMLLCKLHYLSLEKEFISSKNGTKLFIGNNGSSLYFID